MVQAGTILLIEELTDREQQILELIAQGLTNREIAAKLILTTETIKWYNKQLYGKLQVSSRTQAVHQARQLGLLGSSENTSPAAPRTTPHNLPLNPSTFVGRKDAIARLKTLLQDHRLVTLTGPGGSGKTRLAHETARDLLPHFKDGVWLVELAGLRTPAEATDQLAAVLKFNPQNKDPAAAAQRFLANKQLLLVADNLEHLLDFAPTLGELLANSPQLHILATSRERLNLSGEQAFQVLPLHMPDPDEENDPDRLQYFEAIDLFIQRARTAHHDFDPSPEAIRAIARICRQLDGLPLAIELAAARTAMFNPQQLLERLDNRLDLLTAGPRDAPARQRTLRGAIAWSYELLSEEERLLFARLGSFRGSFTIEAVEAVCRIDQPVEALASLLEKNLLFKVDEPSDEPRLAMLETIHEFAREVLQLIGEENFLRDRQLDYYLKRTEEMSAGYRYQEHARLLLHTEVDLPNLRAAFDWAMETGRYDEAAQMISALDYFFRYLHLLAEGYGWIKRVLTVSESLRPEVQARFLLAASVLTQNSGDLKYGKQLAERGLALARKLGNQNLAAWLELEIACSSNFPTEKDLAFEMVEAGLAYFRKTGSESGIAYGLNLLGEFYRLQGDFDKAKEVYDEALEITNKTGEILRQSFIHANLSVLAYHRGDHPLARQLCEKAVRMRLEVGQFFYACTGLAFLAGPLNKLGQSEKAARLLGASDSIHLMYGTEYQHTDMPEVKKIFRAVREELGEETFTNTYDEGAAMNAYEAVDYALDDSR